MQVCPHRGKHVWCELTRRFQPHLASGSSALASCGPLRKNCGESLTGPTLGSSERTAMLGNQHIVNETAQWHTACAPRNSQPQCAPRNSQPQCAQARSFVR
eukprot:356808-Chlamydomonas_euryale.AAC.5